jgi:hypothetical protein
MSEKQPEKKSPKKSTAAPTLTLRHPKLGKAVVNVPSEASSPEEKATYQGLIEKGYRPVEGEEATGEEPKAKAPKAPKAPEGEGK